MPSGHPISYWIKLRPTSPPFSGTVRNISEQKKLQRRISFLVEVEKKKKFVCYRYAVKPSLFISGRYSKRILCAYCRYIVGKFFSLLSLSKDSSFWGSLFVLKIPRATYYINQNTLVWAIILNNTFSDHIIARILVYSSFRKYFEKFRMEIHIITGLYY